tara:strand:+ start:131753 stop:132592 length:840 start_codon:yes stop_codon:yes gene_type:complete
MRTLIFYSLLIITSVTHAAAWGDVWKNTNQRAATRLEQAQFDAAEQTFTRKDWQAVAAYRNKHYAAAEKGFQTQGGAEGLYNQGNALAFQGKYKQAIEAYQKALKLEPKHLDAEYNLALLQELQKNNPPESDKSDKSDKSDESDNNQNNTNKAGNDEGNSNQEKPPQDGDNKQTSNQKQDGANNTPSKPESSESPPDSEQASEQPSEPSSESEAEAGSASQSEEKTPPPESSQHASASPTDADQQAKDQWLRLIPDDPGGLLREKFWRDHMKRLQQRRS